MSCALKRKLEKMSLRELLAAGGVVEIIGRNEVLKMLGSVKFEVWKDSDVRVHTLDRDGFALEFIVTQYTRIQEQIEIWDARHFKTLREFFIDGHRVASEDGGEEILTKNGLRAHVSIVDGRDVFCTCIFPPYIDFIQTA